MAAEVDVVVDISRLEGWVPIRIYPQGPELMVDWCYVGDETFIDPFFSVTIESLLQEPFHVLFRQQTPIAVLEELYLSHPGMNPTGLIFHMTQCGSTTITQAFASVGNLVLSEAEPLEMLLNRGPMTPNISDEQLVCWLRSMVSALGQRRTGAEKHYFIKFNAFPIARLPVLQRAFPEVPWIFVYRDPIEVLASLDLLPGCMVRGAIRPDAVGMDAASFSNMSQDEYLVRLLAHYCKCGLRWHGSSGRLVNFRELPNAIWTSIARHFNVEFTGEELVAMQRRVSFNSKRPQEKYSDDSESKRRMGAPRWRELATKWIGPVYEQLESARTSQQ